MSDSKHQDFVEAVAGEVAENENFVDEVASAVSDIIEEHHEETPFIPEEKVTPEFDLSWYIKWFATIVGICASIATVTNIAPANMILMCLSSIGWLGVSYLWRDRAMILASSVSVFVLIIGIVTYVVNHV